MEASVKTERDRHANPDSLRSFRTAVEVLKQRNSVSIFTVPTAPVQGVRAGGCAADAKRGQPKAIRPEGSPPARSKAGPEHAQEQKAGEHMSLRQKAAEADRQTSPASPAPSQSTSQRGPRARFPGRRGRGRKHGSASAPSVAMATRGYNSAPLVEASPMASSLRWKSRSLPLPGDTVAGNSSPSEPELSQLLQQLQGDNTVKRVRKNGSGSQVTQPNEALCSTLDQTPRQPSSLRLPRRRQQHRRQLMVRPLYRRMTLHIMLPQAHEEAQRISHVLNEVAKAFHCDVEMCEAYQDATDCGGMLYLPVTQCTRTPFVAADGACSWPHSHAYRGQAEGKETHNDASCERQKASRIPDQLTRGAFDQEVPHTLYPEVILTESPPEANS